MKNLLRFGLYPFVPSESPSRAPSFLPSTFLSENIISLPKFVPISISYIDSSQSPSNRPLRFPLVFISVYLSSDPTSVPSYVTSVNPSRAQSEQQVGALQEEMQTSLEQVKAIENVITSGEIKVHEADQLQEFYMIKLKHCI